MKLVIAGSYQQFLYYYPKPDPNVKYVGNISDTFGYYLPKIERIGTWWEMPYGFLRDIELLENRFNSETQRKRSIERKNDNNNT